jgi:hypothetical protein
MSQTPFLIAVQLFPWEHVCFRSRYSVTAVAYLLISLSLPSNWSTCYNIKTLFGKLPRRRPEGDIRKKWEDNIKTDLGSNWFRIWPNAEISRTLFQFHSRENILIK